VHEYLIGILNGINKSKGGWAWRVQSIMHNQREQFLVLVCINIIVLEITSFFIFCGKGFGTKTHTLLRIKCSNGTATTSMDDFLHGCFISLSQLGKLVLSHLCNSTY
jgi:hypothetical protein